MDIAVIGYSFKLPTADNTAEFREMIYGGKDAFRSSGKMGRDDDNWIDSAGYLEDIYSFDYKLFDISLRDSLIIEPQQRMFIQHCWKALEASGYNPTAVDNCVGVFSTSSDSNYLELLHGADYLADKYDPFELEIGCNKEQQSLRVSYLFNLNGPSFAIQSACSSGLLTIHTAIRSLQAGDCDMALAGGASVPFPLPEGYLYREGMNLSRCGKIRSFCNEADGMVSGFGCVVFVLKKLEHAIRDRDHIHAVIKGSRINNDGRAKSSYMAPSTRAVADNIRTLMEQVGVTSECVDFVEAHGSGTKIGDVIEASALRLAFNDGGQENATAVSSVKSSIGHLDTVAGLAGLLKAVVQANDGCIAPAANFSRLNDNISFDGTGLYIPQESSQHDKLTGLVNSLGIGGTNCAMLVESPARPALNELVAQSAGTALDVYVGASSEDRLKRYAQQLVHELANCRASMDEIAFTLSRRAQGKKCIILLSAKDIGSLLALLKSLSSSVPGYVHKVFLPDSQHARAVPLFSGEILPEIEVKLDEPKEQPASTGKADAEKILATIWKDNLMIEDVDAETSFVEAGGHSILALSLLDDINARFNLNLDLDWVDSHNVFRAQLQSIASCTGYSGEVNYLKVLRRASARIKARLVLVHASISGCDAYRQISRYIDSDVEVLGVDSYNLYASEEAIEHKMDVLVNKYVKSIKNTINDRETPLIIGGWSLGGMLSNMICNKLKNDYNVVGLLALDSVLFDQEYGSIFDEKNLQYFLDDACVINADMHDDSRQVRRLSKVFQAERNMAISFRPIVQDLPLLNVVATLSRNKIEEDHVMNAFSLAKKDNGWKIARPLETVYLNTHHEGIVDRDNSSRVSEFINGFINRHVPAHHTIQV